MTRTLAVGLALVVSTTAEAASCDAPYPREDLTGHLLAAQEQLRAGDHDAVKQTATWIEYQLPCLSSVLPARAAATTYRLLGLGRFFSDDEAGASEWFRSAHVADANYTFGVDELAADHSARGVFIDARGSIAPAVQAAPAFAEGIWFIDGKESSEPKGRPGHRHLVQRELDGAVRGWVVLGDAFPSDTTARARPARSDDASSAVQTKHPVTVQRVRPKAKTPLMIAGGALAAAGGGLLVGHIMESRRFDTFTPESADDISRQVVLTNGLAVAAAAMFAAGAGTLTWGVVLDGGASASFRFRF